MREKMKQLKQKLAIIPVVITLLIFLGLTGIVSYAWFTSDIIGNDTAKSIVLKAADLEITYLEGNEINEINILPGWSKTKTFSVENTGNGPVTYKIAWKNLTNNFVNRQYLVYSATSTNGGGTLNQIQIPDSEENILIMDNITIAPGVTQAYSIIFEYLNVNLKQNEDQGRNIAGLIEVLDINEDTILPQTTTGINSIPTTGTTLYGMTKQDLMNEIYPVGSLYTGTSNVNPSELFGGTWERYGKGKALVGVDEEDTDFDSAEKTIGAKTHTLTIAQMPSHTHNVLGGAQSGSGPGIESFTSRYSTTRTISAVAQATGGGAAHNNIQPSITVYIWKRIE